ncbi:hypothetical protein [Nocardioides taihuensis]|uniref:Uncharacterized protein n=1 Tax=Nocardioides taihuensis TaxID=1835606 RepID=A0ABW0BLL8_9ACTN
MTEYQSVEFHPMYGVVGKFVMCFGELEFWVYYALGTLTDQWYVDVAAQGLGNAIERLRKEAKRLPEPHRSQLRDELLWAKGATELRNAVIHGMWFPDLNDEVYTSHRPKPLRLTVEEKAQRTDEERKAHPKINKRFTGDQLLETALRAGKLAGYIQVDVMRAIPGDDDDLD